ncbi:disintegrin and metalloproteinase domain-containing protein 10-like [Saccostrea echinata]|uniref:disintegrin and metalloproteinase domain-containing protein 10-like n=1 Tax=Saccostrea echinata TaxID=191078 RepID=UPI002A82FC17|nr:disintegrin and metalloproteinase domain-containing protein 10-like [Saccostrea echinata]
MYDVEQKSIDDYIKYYEELTYDTQELHNKHLRAKRSTTEGKRLELKFTAHNRSFHLDLKPSTSVFTKNFRSTHNNGTEDPVDLSIIYEGSVRGEPGSNVHGAVILGIFRGKINIPSDTVYHIEPAYRFYGLNEAQKLPYHSVIYKDEHLDLDPYRYKEGTEARTGNCALDRYQDWMVQQTEAEVNLRTKRIYFSQKEKHNKYSAESNDDKNRGIRSAGVETCDNTIPNTCNLYLRSDPVLFNKFNTDLGNNQIAARDEILSLFSTHVNALNEIFRRTRLKSSSTIPCFVQFQIQRTTVMTDSTENCVLQKTKFCQENLDVSNFLNLHSLSNHDSFCLAYTFTYRDFLQGTLGLAWVGSSTASSGGVCERHKSYREGTTEIKKSLNTGVVTLLNYGKRVPPRISELTFAHEVGHNMGSPHDDGKPCAQTTSDQGNYIMFASATKGNLPNNDDFSLCSKNSFTDVITAVVDPNKGKYNCFTQSNMAFCGNGIVEEGEECDCGYDTDCTDKCCNPQQTSGPDSNACTLKIDQMNNRKYNCSPSQGACCSSECTYMDTENQCRPSTECMKAQNCTYPSSTCPASEKEPDLTFCDNFSQVCLNGFCSGSLCLKINGTNINTSDSTTSRWEQCFIPRTGDLTVQDRVELCYLACRQNNSTECYTSNSNLDHLKAREFDTLVKEVNMMKNSSGGVRMPAGAVCNDYQGVCDAFSRCRGVSDEGPLRRLTNLLFSEETLANIKNWIIEHWWATILIGIGVIVFMGIFIKVFSVHTPSTNPDRPVQNHNIPLREPEPEHNRRRKRSSEFPPPYSPPGGPPQGHRKR